jgi:hypothetical protein
MEIIKKPTTISQETVYSVINYAQSFRMNPHEDYQHMHIKVTPGKYNKYRAEIIKRDLVHEIQPHSIYDDTVTFQPFKPSTPFPIYLPHPLFTRSVIYYNIRTPDVHKSHIIISVWQRVTDPVTNLSSLQEIATSYTD